MPRIQPFQGLEHHITFSSRSRTARAWSGHASLATTNVDAEVDLEMKAKALANCEDHGQASGQPRTEDGGLMDFLGTL